MYQFRAQNTNWEYYLCSTRYPHHQMHCRLAEKYKHNKHSGIRLSLLFQHLSLSMSHCSVSIVYFFRATHSSLFREFNQRQICCSISFIRPIELRTVACQMQYTVSKRCLSFPALCNRHFDTLKCNIHFRLVWFYVFWSR